MNNLEAYRRKRGLTQEELAEKAGVDRSLVSKVEKGTRDFNSRAWVNVAKALDCTVDELLRS